MKASLYEKFFLSLSLLCLSFTAGYTLPAFSQAGTDQATVSADQMVGEASRQQVQDLVNQRDSFKLEVSKTEQEDDAYRVYAQKRVDALLKAKKKTKEQQGELYALQHWLNQETKIKAADQARIEQLNQKIASMQQSQTIAIRDMRSDIHNMRVDADAQTADQKFQQQMATNYFNELQSEMGAASWGRPPTDGVLNTQSGSLNRLFRGGGGGGAGGYAIGGYNY
jgi:hypothetical protein